MTGQPQTLRCARCSREAPLPDSPELVAWNVGALESIHDLGDSATYFLLCPECREETRSDEELGGGG